jgi:hypothetical protein
MIDYSSKWLGGFLPSHDELSIKEVRERWIVFAEADSISMK